MLASIAEILVDPHRAGVDPAGDLGRAREIAAPHGAAQPRLRVVRTRDDVVEIGRAQHRQDRAELFLADQRRVVSTTGFPTGIGCQNTTVDAISTCGANCSQPWLVARVDADTGQGSVAARGAGSARVDYACGALEVDDTLYITVRGDDRLAYRQVAKR